MLHTEDFIKRLEFIMEHYGLSASSFADKVSVQRSSISHLLSGRNKPSLDFVMKILDVFPELNLYWFLNGSGTYLKNEIVENPTIKIEIDPTPQVADGSKNDPTLFSEIDVLKAQQEKTVVTSRIPEEKIEKKKIERIVIFYSDGSFQSYDPTSTQ